MVAHGAQKFLGPLPVTEGPAAGQSINYFRTPFGTYIELISYPNGMAYERDPGRPLWSPKRNGTTSTVTSVPGLLGIDHVGITVPNVAEAVAWFEDVLGCTSPLAFGPFCGRRRLCSTSIRARSSSTSSTCAAATARASSSSSTRRPDQDRTFRLNSDFGGKHIAFYVRHIDKAVARMGARGAEARRPPAVTEGPAAGQTINYFRTPFGTYIELISYPQGEAYAENAPIPLWDPRDNRP